MFDNTKPVWQSKTVWVNAIVAILAIYDQIAPFIPQEWLPKAAAVVGVLNIILRVFATRTPIRLPGEDTGA